MNIESITRLYDLRGKTFVVTGGTGILGSAIVASLGSSGAAVALVSRDMKKADALIAQLGNNAVKCKAFQGDVLDKVTVERSCKEILDAFGRVDGLINGAGGNSPKATSAPDCSFFQLDEQGLRFVSDLNLLGTVIPCQVFGKIMAEQKEGVILNLSSMSAFRPLTNIPAYSAAKSAVSNFTQWLAVHMAQEYSPRIRVNAIAPGFFLTEQNRFLLTEKETGQLTARGKKIIEHTPMARFGQPEELIGAVHWLLSPASQFVTGVVIPIDGGFSAYSGV